MFFKKCKKTISFLLLLLVIPSGVLAYSDYIIPGGENIGIELHSKGVLIVGTYKIGDASPSTESGLKVGDTIIKVNENSVSTIQEMVNQIENRGMSDTVKLTYIRNDLEKETSLKLYKSGDVYKTGLYVKDNIMGVGTLTYIDPNTKSFGALGHEIIEKNTGKILEIKDGKVMMKT